MRGRKVLFSRAFIEWANASDTSNIDLDWAIKH